MGHDQIDPWSLMKKIATYISIVRGFRWSRLSPDWLLVEPMNKDVVKYKGGTE